MTPSAVPSVPSKKRPADVALSAEADPVENDSSRSASSFVQSMTFATNQRTAPFASNDLQEATEEDFWLRGGGGAGCDCCDEPGCRTGDSVIPLTIQQAIEAYQQRQPLQRTQERQVLVTAAATPSKVSVYQFTLPLDARQPLTEFGQSSHRLVWVRRLSDAAVLCSVGSKGVVGSADEEASRQRLPWKSGQVYLVPARPSAVGWLLQSSTIPSEMGSSSEDRTTEPCPPAELIVVKCPLQSLEAAATLNETDDPTEKSRQEDWTSMVRNIYTRSMQTGSEADCALSERDSVRLKECLAEFL